ncbi:MULTISPECIES: hypothetical protein [unclassified Streptomyces]
MTLALGYHRLVTPQAEQLFRAYVDDVTARRHCTDLVLPEGSAFRAD